MGNAVKMKGLNDFLEEDKSLTEKITYEQFKNKQTAPDNSDDAIEMVYRNYQRALEKIQM